jgi:phage terminase small subunit
MRALQFTFGMTKTREVINMALSDKHKRFADEYLIDMNATAAYQRAGYTATGNAAESAASRLLRNVQIQEYISEKQKKVGEKLDITVEWILEQYKDIVSNTKTTEPNVARAALADLGKYKGMFKDKLEITGHVTVESILEEL